MLLYNVSELLQREQIDSDGASDANAYEMQLLWQNYPTGRQLFLDCTPARTLHVGLLTLLNMAVIGIIVSPLHKRSRRIYPQNSCNLLSFLS